MPAVGVLNLSPPLHLPPAPTIRFQTSTAWQPLSSASASVAMATIWLPPSGKLVAKALVAKGYNSHPGV